MQHHAAVLVAVRLPSADGAASSRRHGIPRLFTKASTTQVARTATQTSHGIARRLLSGAQYTVIIARRANRRSTGYFFGSPSVFMYIARPTPSAPSTIIKFGVVPSAARSASMPSDASAHETYSFR